MIHAIVPVKDLRYAKTRLADVLTLTQRRALMLAMLRDVLAALHTARGIAAVTVISRDADALALARQCGALALRDEASDLNGALTQAARHALALGAAAVLALPADVPLVTPLDIEALLAVQGGEHGVVLAPSRDGGTNALLMRPPLLMPYLFGASSRSRHSAAAYIRDIPLQVFRTWGLEHDIDRPEDLALLDTSYVRRRGDEARGAIP